VKLDIVAHRLVNQRLVEPAGARRQGPGQALRPDEIVSWLGAVQSQDFAGAKWALGQRASGLTDAGVEQAFDEGRILRTHVMRPTWHFLAPADIGWLLELTAPRLHALNALYYRRNELDPATFRRSRRVLERSLGGGQSLTRSELARALHDAGISAAGERLAYLMMHAELERVICSGPRRGKQFTYMLLDARAPDARRLDREAALAELTRRYFTSHGPATIRDFSWWSGLTARDARAGLDAIGSSISSERIGDRIYWFMPVRPPVPLASPRVFLFPNYDEFLIAYKDRDFLTPPRRANRKPPRDAYAHHLVIDERLRGSWQRTATASDGIRIDVQTYDPLSRAEARALEEAAGRCGQFTNRRAALTILT
jgi:hypothetical protein